MPPKESKETKSEIKTVIDLVKGYWPEFEINNELFSHPTKEFVTKFYTDVLADLNEKISFLLNEEGPINDPESKEFDYEVQLFCSMARFFKKLKVDAFCINDIYRPVPKRTRFFIQSAIHFLIYTDNYLQVPQNLTDDIFKQVEEKEKLHFEKQELLQKIAQQAENIVREDERHKKLLTERDTISREYEKMLNEKHEKGKARVDKHLQTEKLSKECEMEEYQLTCLEKEEPNLKEQLISEEDYKDLKDMEKALECQLQELSCEDVGIGDSLSQEKGNLDSIEEIVNTLAQINLDLLSKKISRSNELGDSKKKEENEIANISKEINHVKSALFKLKSKTEALTEKLVMKENEFAPLQKQITEKLNHVKAEFERHKKSTSEKTKKYNEYEKSIQDLEEKLNAVENDEKRFKEIFFAEYKKILNSNRQLFDTVFSVLSKLRDESRDEC